jgi:hypothetical protein
LRLFETREIAGCLENLKKATEKKLPGVIRIIFEEAESGRDLGNLLDNAEFRPKLKGLLATLKDPEKSAVDTVEFRNRVYRASPSPAISGATPPVISPPPDPSLPSASAEALPSPDQ